MKPLNETHDPGLRSWVESAQQPGGDFSIQNQPHGVLRDVTTMIPPPVSAARLSHTSFRHTYGSPAQWIAHHTHNGCNLQPGDLPGRCERHGHAPIGFGECSGTVLPALT